VSPPPLAPPAQPTARLYPPAPAPVPVRSESIDNTFLNKLGIQASLSDPPPAKRAPRPRPPKAPNPVEAPAPSPPLNPVPNSAASANSSMSGPPEINNAPGQPPRGLSPTADPEYSSTPPLSTATLHFPGPSSEFVSEQNNGAPVSSRGRPKVHNLQSNKKAEPTKEMIVRSPRPNTRNQKPETRNPKPEIRNPKTETLNSNPGERAEAERHG